MLPLRLQPWAMPNFLSAFYFCYEQEPAMRIHEHGDTVGFTSKYRIRRYPILTTVIRAIFNRLFCGRGKNYGLQLILPYLL